MTRNEDLENEAKRMDEEIDARVDNLFVEIEQEEGAVASEQESLTSEDETTEGSSLNGKESEGLRDTNEEELARIEDSAVEEIAVSEEDSPGTQETEVGEFQEEPEQQSQTAVIRPVEEPSRQQFTKIALECSGLWPEMKSAKAGFSHCLIGRDL